MRASWNDPFWKPARDLLRFKKQVAIAALGAALAAACFGAGLGMLLPIFHLLLQNHQSLPQLIQGYLVESSNPLLAWLGGELVHRVPADPFWGFTLVMALMVAISAVGGLGRFLHTFTVYRIVQRTSAEWKKRLFRRFIHAPLADSLGGSYGDKVSRIVHDTNMLAAAYRAIFAGAVTKGLNGAVAIVAAFWVNWELALIGMISAPVIGLMVSEFSRRIRAASSRAVKRRGRLITRLREAVQHFLVVKANQAEGYECRRFGREIRQLNADEMRVRKMDAISKPLVETLTITGVAAVACAAAYQVLRRDVPAEEFITVIALLAAAGAALQRMMGINNLIHEASPCAQHMLEAFDSPVETEPHATARLPRLARHKAAVEFDRVSFSYPGQLSPAVCEASLRVPHGQTVAIVGGNGSGKTTLLRLLPRHLEPTSGRVLIDGSDISSVRLRSLRDQIALVTQDTVLFRATIAANIAYGRPHASRAQVIAAARVAMAEEFIERLPLGYDTDLGDDGAGLSGGEKQRLCIARAILRNPAILILDEATSQVDAESEARISQVLRAFREGRTTFIIAHRLSTVVDADLILVMHQGRIIDRGKHDELLRRCEVYRLLAQNQMLDPAGAN